MPINIPLPNAPAGSFLEGFGKANAISDQLLQNQIKSIQAKYAPLTTQADAASKIAYAKLMGPQFLSKLMGNEDILANMTPDQRNQALQIIYKTGSGQSTGNALLNNELNSDYTQQDSSLTGYLTSKLRNLFDGRQNDELQQPSQQINALSHPSQQVNLPQMKPGQSYTNNTSFPQEVSVQEQSPNYDFFTQSGKEQGKKQQEIELGKARGQSIADLGKQYAKDLEAMEPLNRLKQLSQSPTFINMRKNIPFFQGLQLNALSKIGNPEEQKIIGDFIVDTRNAVANTVNSFDGRAMAKEFDFANTMKINDNDTLNVMLGKLESLISFKQASMERNKIARELMKNHMDEGDAYEQANKQVNMENIRNNIASQLPFPIKIKNKKTGETKLVTVKEYNEMLNKK
jgi:hypothetical protein